METQLEKNMEHGMEVTVFRNCFQIHRDMMPIVVNQMEKKMENQNQAGFPRCIRIIVLYLTVQKPFYVLLTGLNPGNPYDTYDTTSGQ